MTTARKSIIFVFFASSLFLGSFVFAQLERPLEVPFPTLGEIPAITKTPLLPDYVRYIFNASIGIGGFIAFSVLIFGGFKYLTSAGDPAKMSDAKDRIANALLGMVLLLGSWLLLTTINPQLIVINPKYTESGLTAGELEGVYLCKDTSSLITNPEDCQYYDSSKPEVGDLNDIVKDVRFVNSEVTQYGVVLHEDSHFKGKCAICLGGNCASEIAKIGGGLSSVNLFAQATEPSPGPGVTLYECEEHRYTPPPDTECKKWGSFTNTGLTPVNTDYKKDDPDSEKILGRWGRSVEILPEDRYLLAIFDGPNGQDWCEVFKKSASGLAGSSPSTCGNTRSDVRCFSSIIVLPIKNSF